MLEKILDSPLDFREIQQSIPKEINSEYSLEGLMLKLKFQYFGHLIWRTDSFEKMLMLGKTEGRRRRGWQRMRWLDGITNLMDMSEQALGDGEGQGSLACCTPWGHKVLDMTEQLNHNRWLVSTLTPEKHKSIYLAMNSVLSVSSWQCPCDMPRTPRLSNF